jgi:hypothetical protein
VGNLLEISTVAGFGTLECKFWAKMGLFPPTLSGLCFVFPLAVDFADGDIFGEGPPPVLAVAGLLDGFLPEVGFFGLLDFPAGTDLHRSEEFYHLAFPGGVVMGYKIPKPPRIDPRGFLVRDRKRRLNHILRLVGLASRGFRFCVEF